MNKNLKFANACLQCFSFFPGIIYVKFGYFITVSVEEILKIRKVLSLCTQYHQCQDCVAVFDSFEMEYFLHDLQCSCIFHLAQERSWESVMVSVFSASLVKDLTIWHSFLVHHQTDIFQSLHGYYQYQVYPFIPADLGQISRS